MSASAVGAVSSVVLALIHTTPKLLDHWPARTKTPTSQASTVPSPARAEDGSRTAGNNEGSVNQGNIQNNGSGPIIVGDVFGNAAKPGNGGNPPPPAYDRNGPKTVSPGRVLKVKNGDAALQPGSGDGAKSGGGQGKVDDGPQPVVAPKKTTCAPMVAVDGPSTPPTRTFTVDVRVTCGPGNDDVYLLADRIENIGLYQTTNVYPKRLANSSYSMSLTVPSNIAHTYLVYAVPPAELSEVRAKMAADQYWYDQEPVPATFDLVSRPITVTPQM